MFISPLSSRKFVLRSQHPVSKPSDWSCEWTAIKGAGFSQPTDPRQEYITASILGTMAHFKDIFAFQAIDRQLTEDIASGSVRLSTASTADERIWSAPTWSISTDSGTSFPDRKPGICNQSKAINYNLCHSTLVLHVCTGILIQLVLMISLFMLFFN